MVYPCRLYLDTGFSHENIPDSSTILDSDSIQKLDVDAIWLYQNQEVGTIRVKSSFDSIYPVDYCRIGLGVDGNSAVAYYFVTNVTMLNPTTAELSLEIDAITTIGLQNILNNINGGWCTRRCVTDDKLFNNVIDEDFIPSQPLVSDSQELKISNNGILVIVSTIDLYKVSDKLADEYAASLTELDANVVVPTVPAINFNYTTITIDYDGLKLSRELVGKRMYIVPEPDEVNSTPIRTRLLNALTSIWSLGLNDAIAGIYYLPLGNKGSGQFNYSVEIDLANDPSYVKELTVFGGSFNLDKIPFKWNTTNIKNNKVFATKYNVYRLISMVSGNEANYYAGDIYDNIEQPTAPNIVINIDSSDNGTSYAKPEYIRGVDLSESSKNFEIVRDAVTGGDWVNANVIMTRPKGSSKTLNAINLDRANIWLGGASNLAGNLSLPNLSKNGNLYESWTTPYQPSTSLVSKQQMYSGALDQVNPVTSHNWIGNPVISGLGNILGFLGGVKDLTTNLYANNQQSINTVLQSPETWFPIDNTLSLFYGNSYYVIRERLSDSDSLRLDRYLTMYGYKVNEPLTKECFYGRQYFNYVMCEGLDIKKINRVPLRLKQLAISQLSSGVRVWHTIVNTQAYSNNPIVTGG